MNVTLCSAFRSSESYLNRYFDQVEDLRDCLLERGDLLDCVWGEGDSTDDTLDMLMFGNDLDATIVDVNHGGKALGSVVDAQRFKQLAFVANKIWQQIPGDADAVIWVESDLIWTETTMLALLNRLKEVPCVAPMVMLDREGYSKDTFYDFWAGRKHDKQFSPNPPYFSGWRADSLVQVDSMGSCLVMDAALARQVHFTEDEVIVGLCRDIYQKGGSVWMDSRLSVSHK